MCGIFGYIGNKNAADAIIDGLKRLDYRGYDSWGVAIVTNGIISVDKQVGKIADVSSLQHLLNGHIGIGHTRWATHGAVTQVNAHPHYATDKSFVLAQNGMVENYEELKKGLIQKGYSFLSQTDTEVIVRLIEERLKETKDLFLAVRTVFNELSGRNTIIVLANTGEIIAARNGSPLVIGVNDRSKEIFFSSDTLSFAPYTKKMIVLENGQVAQYTKGKLAIFDIKNGKEIGLNVEAIGFESKKIDREGYEHFMIKEIHETPEVINRLIQQDIKQYEAFTQAIKQAANVYTIGSGTAGGAAAQIAYYLREYSKIKAVSLIGADAMEYYDLFSKRDIIIAPSQSGETADVLEVLEIAKQQGTKIASFVNMPGSMMTRMSDYKFMAHAGPEICVMSTKIYISQIAWGYLISKIIQGKKSDGISNLRLLSQFTAEYLGDVKNHESVKDLAKKLTLASSIFLLGKAQNFQILKEGMIKLCEATYKHAHAIPSGDLKHYIMPLMEKGVPVITTLSNDKARTDVISSINQVKARGAVVFGISSKRDENFDYFLSVPETGETSAIMNVIPLQLLAYYMAVALGNNVDKPRNIAKSVTVK